MSESSDSESGGETGGSLRARHLVLDMKAWNQGSTDAKLMKRLSLYHTVGRWIPVGVNPFIPLKRILSIGIWFRIAPVDTHTRRKAKLEKLTEENVQNELKCFDHIMELIPDGPVLLQEVVEEKDGLDTFINYMHEKASNARSDDTKALKKAIIEYIPLDSENGTIQPPIRSTNKRDRGFNHPHMARLLCPRHQLDEFDIDPTTFIAQVKNGERKIKETHFPTFLYDELQEYDPEQKISGLLEGHIVIRVYRHIMTGPRTACKPNLITLKDSRCKTGRVSFMKSDRYTIAYAATQGRHVLHQDCNLADHNLQARFVISSADKWGDDVEGIDLENFYNRIVTVLSNEEDPMVQNIFDRFNKECNFEELRRKAEANESETESDTDDELREIEMSWDIRRQQMSRVNYAQEPQISPPMPSYINAHNVDDEQQQEGQGEMDIDSRHQSPGGLSIYSQAQLQDTNSSPNDNRRRGTSQSPWTPENVMYTHNTSNASLDSRAADLMQMFQTFVQNGGFSPNCITTMNGFSPIGTTPGPGLGSAVQLKSKKRKPNPDLSRPSTRSRKS